MRCVLSAIEVSERDLIRPFASLWHSQETAGIYENLMTIPGADIQDFFLIAVIFNIMPFLDAPCLAIVIFEWYLILGHLPLYDIFRK